MTARKAVERRVGHGTADYGQLVALPTAAPAPAPVKGWLATTGASWVRLWSSPLAQVYDVTDLPALERLFDLLDRRERYVRAVRHKPMVEGSQGQPVAHPLARQVPVLDAEIRQMEDRFGLTPAARLKLGITFGAAQQTLADLNAALADDGEDDDRFRL
jgi:P27 family predicted phage terminase small subunit